MADTKTPDLTPGRIVLYTLNDADIERIADHREKLGPLALAYGNKPHVGDVVPLIVVRAWDERRINGQAFLDGNDRLWITSAHEGEASGEWHYPPRA